MLHPMNDIFESHNLYPFSGKIKDHFAGTYDEVMIAFLPFYDQQVDGALSEQEIHQTVKPISWETIRVEAGFQDLSELYKALKTSIGSVRPIFATPDMAVQLNDYLELTGFQSPVEGAYDTFTKVAIYQTFELLGEQKIVVTDEFYESSYTLDLSEMNAFEFAEKLAGDAYYIYPENRRFLIAMEWDSYFFLITSGAEEMKKIRSSEFFEGFLCDADTEHIWQYLPGELETLLAKEHEQRSTIWFKLKRLFKGFKAWLKRR